MVTKATKPIKIVDIGDLGSQSPLYRIPRESVRKSLKPGYFVKICFVSETMQNGTDRERLWVEVTGGKNPYTGVLRSSPAFLKDLIPGEPILFDAEHVSDVSLPQATV